MVIAIVDGEFSDNYEVLRQVGRGAYGCVQSGQSDYVHSYFYVHSQVNVTSQ